MDHLRSHPVPQVSPIKVYFPISDRNTSHGGAAVGERGLYHARSRIPLQLTLADAAPPASGKISSPTSSDGRRNDSVVGEFPIPKICCARDNTRAFIRQPAASQERYWCAAAVSQQQELIK